MEEKCKSKNIFCKKKICKRTNKSACADGSCIGEKEFCSGCPIPPNKKCIDGSSHACCPQDTTCIKLGPEGNAAWCSPDDKGKCDDPNKPKFCSASKSNTCCLSDETCEEKSGYAICKVSDETCSSRGENGESWISCGKFCCDPSHYKCVNRIGIGKVCDAIPGKCGEDKTFCYGKYYSICCEPGSQCRSSNGGKANCDETAL